MSNGKGLFFDGIPYTAADMVAYLGNICSDGVLMNEESLKPTSSGMDVHILGGTAYLKGYCYILEAEGCDFSVESGSRTDIIVVQLDTINKTLQLALKQNQEEPLENEIGVAKLAVNGETLTVTDIRERATFKLPMATNSAEILEGSYTGTGYSNYPSIYGSVSLALEKRPKILFIHKKYSAIFAIAFFDAGEKEAYCIGVNPTSDLDSGAFYITYDNGFASWDSTKIDPDYCLNEAGATYHYYLIY